MRARRGAAVRWWWWGMATHAYDGGGRARRQAKHLKHVAKSIDGALHGLDGALPLRHAQQRAAFDSLSAASCGACLPFCDAAIAAARAAVHSASGAGPQSVASQEKVLACPQAVAWVREREGKQCSCCSCFAAQLLAAMKETRVHADEIETLASATEFALPTYVRLLHAHRVLVLADPDSERCWLLLLRRYHDMLFSGHTYDVQPSGISTH